MAPWCIHISCLERVARSGSGRDSVRGLVGAMDAELSRPDWLATVQSGRKQVQSRVCTPSLSQRMARWCDGGRIQSSRVGTLTDKAVKTAPRRAAETTVGKVEIDNNVLDNVYTFEYLGSRLQGDGDDKPTCVIAWTLRKRHSRHCPTTYGRIITFHAI